MPPMSSAARVLCPSIRCLPAVLGSATTAAAADGWSAAPSGGGRPSFCAEGAPGSVLRDAVSVTNRCAGPITVRLRGTGAPIVFADRAVRIPARTRADVTFTVTVPAGDRGAELPPGRRVHLTEPWLDRPALDAVDVRLTVTAAGGAGDTADASVRFAPWGAVAGAGGAVAAGGAFRAVRRRRRRRDDGAAPESPCVEAELTGATT
jgi:hypothetical protein